MSEAAVGIGVFLENATIYTDAMSKFAERVPAYIYLTSDGPYPVSVPGTGNTLDQIIKYWYKQTIFNVSGIAQETCRDLGHTSLGISAMAHVAETARIQGIDLWMTELGVRMKAALELLTPLRTADQKIPKWLCNGRISGSLGPGMLSFALRYKMQYGGSHVD